MSTDLLYSVEQRVATITFNRPEKMNAISPAMLERFFARVADAAADPEVRAIVVTGAGRAFCAGVDLGGVMDLDDEAPSVPGTPTPAADQPPPQWDDGVGPALARQFAAGWSGLIRARKPTIAAVNGAAYGWGAIFALHCDLRFAARSAVMNFTFARLGVPAEKASAWLLTRLVGPARSADLLYTARRIEMAEAERIGLVNSVHDDALLAHAMAYARQLAEHSAPRSLAAMKAQIWMALDESYDDAYLKADDEQARCMRTQDFKEGFTSYMEKRAPSFTGY
ncbi:enoyl-CoA hydratase/isomerase family protein [Trinickia mobilis]|uniref:enoyl-CoA hydratase/isomerase family protein n=1 Tax=Trinickia mobilis TaxID=2816356 RepID=UPI001A8CF4A1|nr:enoyl-CoA hydratase-related protein [Trinickia mobilis]